MFTAWLGHISLQKVARCLRRKLLADARKAVENAKYQYEAMLLPHQRQHCSEFPECSIFKRWSQTLEHLSFWRANWRQTQPWFWDSRPSLCDFELLIYENPTTVAAAAVLPCHHLLPPLCPPPSNPSIQMRPKIPRKWHAVFGGVFGATQMYGWQDAKWLFGGHLVEDVWRHPIDAPLVLTHTFIYRALGSWRMGPLSDRCPLTQHY